MAETYKVTLAQPLSFPADERPRAGIVVTKAYGWEGELTDEQLAEIRADEHLVIDILKPAAPKPPTKAELLAGAEAEGLVLEGLTDKSTKAEVEAAIAAARAVKRD